MKATLKEADLLALLRARFPDPEYALLPHVAEATGGYSTRTADAIAMSVWPSRGLELLGFELKSSRSDWLREMRNPAKAEGIAKYMDRWWLVIAERAIVQPGELPPTWGLLAAHGGTLRAEVEAPRLEPRPFNRSFLAAVLRSAARKLVEPDGVTELLRVEHDKGYREGQKDAKRFGMGADDERELAEMREAVAQFEKASGIQIRRAGGAARLGEVVDFLVGHDGWNRVLNSIETMKRADADLHVVLDRFAPSDEPPPDFRSWRPRR